MVVRYTREESPSLLAHHRYCSELRIIIRMGYPNVLERSRPWLAISVGSLFMMLLGSLYAFSSFSKDLQSFGFADVALLGSLGNVGSYVCSIGTGALLDRIGAKYTTLLATALATTGWISLRYSLEQSSSGPVATSLALIGLAGSTGYMAVGKSCYALFATKFRGRVTGVLLAAYSLSAVIWAPLYASYFAGRGIPSRSGSDSGVAGLTWEGLPGYAYVMSVCAAAVGSITTFITVNHKTHGHATADKAAGAALKRTNIVDRVTHHSHITGKKRDAIDKANHSSDAKAADGDRHSPLSDDHHHQDQHPPSPLHAPHHSDVTDHDGDHEETPIAAVAPRHDGDVSPLPAEEEETPAVFESFALRRILWPCGPGSAGDINSHHAAAAPPASMDHSDEEHGAAQSHTVDTTTTSGRPPAVGPTATGAPLARQASDAFAHHDGRPSDFTAAAVFYTQFVAAFVVIGGALVFLNNISLSLHAAVPVAEDNAPSTNDAVWTAVLTFALSNTIARALGGWAGDTLAARGQSRLYVYYIAVLTVTAGTAILASAPVRGMLPAAVLVGVGDGCAFSTWPVLTAEFYGKRRYGLMFAVINSSLGFGSLSLNAMASSLYKANGSLNAAGKAVCYSEEGQCFRATWVITAVLVFVVGNVCLGYLLWFQRQLKARLKVLSLRKGKSVGHIQAH